MMNEYEKDFAKTLNFEPKHFDRTFGKRITEKGLEKVAQAVSEVENILDLEIVPILVYTSTPPPPYLFPFLTFLFELIVMTSIPFFAFNQENHSYIFALASICVVLFSWSISHSLWVQRLFSGNHFYKELFVRRRALVEFHLNKIESTHRHNGILIFVSFFERKAMVYTDPQLTKSIREKIDSRNQQTSTKEKSSNHQDIWSEILVHLIAELRKGPIDEAFVRAIDSAGKLLADLVDKRPESSIKKTHENELPNRLIVKY